MSDAPSRDWREDVGPDEDARFLALAEQLRDLQRANAKKRGVTDRALHAKGHLGVEAELTVKPDLPEHARFGVFREPKTFKAFVRSSNGAGTRQHDAKDDVRGLGIKVVGVAGKKLIPGMEDEVTQDFLVILSASTPFRGPEEFVTTVRAAANPLLLLPRLIGGLGFGRAFSLLKKLSGGFPKSTSVATSRYFSALPVQYGPYAVHYGLRPHAAPSGEPAKRGASFFGEELAERLRKGPVVYDFQVQFYGDATKTPIEDASIEWRESDAPFVTVGTLTLLQQDVTSARGERIGRFVEGLSFDPWHALVEHRPLGAMMRARNHAYRLSTEERRASKEPTGDESFD